DGRGTRSASGGESLIARGPSTWSGRSAVGKGPLLLGYSSSTRRNVRGGASDVEGGTGTWPPSGPPPSASAWVRSTPRAAIRRRSSASAHSLHIITMPSDSPITASPQSLPGRLEYGFRWNQRRHSRHSASSVASAAVSPQMAHVRSVGAGILNSGRGRDQ